MKRLTLFILVVFCSLIAYGSNFRVNVSSLNVREKPTTNSHVIGSIDRGQEIEGQLVSNNQSWVQIKYNGQTGYISRDYVVQITDAQPQSQKTDSVGMHSVADSFLSIMVVLAILFVIVFFFARSINLLEKIRVYVLMALFCGEIIYFVLLNGTIWFSNTDVVGYFAAFFMSVFFVLYLSLTRLTLTIELENSSSADFKNGYYASLVPVGILFFTDWNILAYLLFAGIVCVYIYIIIKEDGFKFKVLSLYILGMIATFFMFLAFMDLSVLNRILLIVLPLILVGYADGDDSVPTHSEHRSSNSDSYSSKQRYDDNEKERKRKDTQDKIYSLKAEKRSKESQISSLRSEISQYDTDAKYAASRRIDSTYSERMRNSDINSARSNTNRIVEKIKSLENDIRNIELRI